MHPADPAPAPEPVPSPEPALAAEAGGPQGARVLSLLLGFLPVTLGLELLGVHGPWLFLCAVLGIVPLAGFLGRATEEIAIRSSPTLGGLLNATFGNAIELLIALQILFGRDPGAPQLVRASIVGSLVTNLLLLLGLSMFAGGLRFKEQRFNSVAAGISASLLIIAFAGLSIPTIYAEFVDPAPVETLSVVVSAIMAMLYVAGLVFTFYTHRHLFDTADELKESRKPEWTLRRAVAVLAVTLAAVGWLSEVLARTITEAGAGLGVGRSFLGVVVIGAITNVAENLAAVAYARRGLLDLSIQIGASSAIQVLLFVVPILVFAGSLAPQPFALHFSLFELACMLLPVLIVNHLAADGMCNWLEGLQLIALYAIIGSAFWFVK